MLTPGSLIAYVNILKSYPVTLLNMDLIILSYQKLHIIF